MCRTDIGRPSPSLPACAGARWSRPWYSTAHERDDLRDLPQRMSCSQMRRRCDHGQSSGPQGCRSTRSHRRSRSETTLSSQIFPGSQPDRASLQQTASASTKSGRANYSAPLAQNCNACLHHRQECTNYFRYAEDASSGQIALSQNTLHPLGAKTMLGLHRAIPITSILVRHMLSETISRSLSTRCLGSTRFTIE